MGDTMFETLKVVTRAFQPTGTIHRKLAYSKWSQRTATNHRLKELEAAGHIESERRGKTKFWRRKTLSDDRSLNNGT